MKLQGKPIPQQLVQVRGRVKRSGFWDRLIVELPLSLTLGGVLFSVVREIIRESAHIIQCDIENPERGEDWWGNVLFLARQPEVNIDVGIEARKLREQWGHSM